MYKLVMPITREEIFIVSETCCCGNRLYALYGDNDVALELISHGSKDCIIKAQLIRETRIRRIIK